MTKKRYYCDDELEYRSYGIFDLSKADKSMDDFRDEDGICSWQFGNYLVEETDSMLNGDEVVNRLNEQEEQITALKSILWNTHMANTRLKEQIKAISKELDYIQNSITDKIKHQKTKIGEKALKEVIEDYNEWILGHKEIVK